MYAPEETSRGFGRRAGYHRITIVHGDRVRAFQIDGARMWAAAAVVGVFGLAFFGASGYLLFRDDILRGAISRQVVQARVYEDRVAELRGEIDRINGRRLIDQESFEAKLDRLLVRQEKLSADQSRIGGLAASAAEFGLTPPKGAAGGLQPIGAARPAEPTETGSVPAPLDLGTFATPLRSSRFEHDDTDRPADPSRRIAAVEGALDGLETVQHREIGRIADLAEARAKRVTRALGQIGFRLSEPRQKPLEQIGGTGGPFVPDPAADPVVRAEAAFVRLGLLKKAAASLPLARPLPGDLTITSGFGSRVDPFLGVPALHTGIDYRADAGEPVHVTGPGTVVAAGRQGGYGLCVDVEHPNGIVTRYGHLSRIGATVGQRVGTGEVIGFAGSTGRSTATHLHYETRVAGEPVDPTGFLDAGRELGL
jgi:murein DD-endopeptidase MepM/ murein hydrolase activator NlpD